MDKLHALAIFVAVAENQSLVRAAERLELSAPAVTRALAALEKSLGCRLLERTTRRVRLTEQGARYFEDCRRILSDLREAEEWLSGDQAAPRGVLALTAPVMFGQLFVMPVVRDYLDAYPAMQARAALLDRVVNLLEEGHDVALRIGELPDSGLIALKVGEVRRVVCASPEYLERQGVPQNPADLTEHRLVRSESASGRSWRFEGFSLRTAALTVNTNQAALDAAVAGWGMARLLSYQVAAPLAEGKLRLVLRDYEPPAWPIHVLHHPGPRLAPKVRLFVDLLAARLRQHPALRALGG